MWRYARCTLCAHLVLKSLWGLKELLTVRVLWPCGDGRRHRLIDPLANPPVDALIDPLSNEQMLRDLGASPGSVSDERAKEVFDAVLRNGLPETQASTMSRRNTKSHHVMANGWVAGASNESNANLVQRKERTDFGDKVPISPGGRLRWSLFLEAMVGGTYFMTLQLCTASIHFYILWYGVPGTAYKRWYVPGTYFPGVLRFRIMVSCTILPCAAHAWSN